MTDYSTTTTNQKPYDPAVWAPIDTCFNGKQVQPKLEGTTGGDAPYPPAYNGGGLWGMRLSPLTIASDVDHYDAKRGASTIDDLEAQLGDLPPTYKVTARGPDDPGGKFLYQVPEGWTGRDIGQDVELLRNGHRFIAMGMHHKTGNEVKIYDDSTGDEVALADVLLENIPALPRPWLDYLGRPESPPLPPTDVDEFDRAKGEDYRRATPDQSLGHRNELLNFSINLLACGFTADEVQDELPRVALALDASPWKPADFKGMTNTGAQRRADQQRAEWHAERAAKASILAGAAVPDYVMNYQETPVTALSATETAEPFKVLTLAQMKNRPPLSWLVDGWVHEGEPGYIAGAPGNGKTLIALDMACCVALGLAWHGHEVKQGHVVYVAAESVGGLPARISAWERLNNQDYPSKLDGHITFLDGAPQLLDRTHVDKIIAVVREQAAVLVLLDTQARMTVGVDEDKAVAMGPVIAAVGRIVRETGATVLALHHTPKGAAGLRGSGAQLGAADTVIMVSMDGLRLSVTTELGVGGKQKDGEPRTEGFTVKQAAGSVAVATGLSALPKSTCDVLWLLKDGGGYKVTELVGANGENKPTRSTVRRAMLELDGRNFISKGEPGRTGTVVYKIAPFGLQYLGLPVPRTATADQLDKPPE